MDAQIFLLMGQALAVATIGVCFTQSGVDKIIDRTGNLDWLIGHFRNSPLKNLVPQLLTALTLLELVSGFSSVSGAVILLFGSNNLVAVAGLLMSSFTLFVLFAAQRIAKDYKGAATIICYLGFCLIGLLLFFLPA
jgi:uncharacterized membrane protein